MDLSIDFDSRPNICTSQIYANEHGTHLLIVNQIYHQVEANNIPNCVNKATICASKGNEGGKGRGLRAQGFLPQRRGDAKERKDCFGVCTDLKGQCY